ncbi:hypothetical protein FF38_05193 [Lucilia cuprina]|uniref:Uncharacterized protein n=1 Tax=Lucilia cuprina TaxID=7375 RepID=A0A0L0C9Y1_LUCCU|nr:hypothetical protein FF38_05193 [Lucilia cuprina]
MTTRISKQQLLDELKNAGVEIATNASSARLRELYETAVSANAGKDGTARLLLNKTDVISYAQLKEVLIKEFGRAINRGEIYKIMANYKWNKKEVENIVSRCSDIDEFELIGFIIDGMQDNSPESYLLINSWGTIKANAHMIDNGSCFRCWQMGHDHRSCTNPKKLLLPRKKEVAAVNADEANATDDAYGNFIKTFNNVNSQRQFSLASYGGLYRIPWRKEYFTTLDLRNGFFHVKMAPDSVKYTSFETPYAAVRPLELEVWYSNDYDACAAAVENRSEHKKYELVAALDCEEIDFYVQVAQNRDENIIELKKKLENESVKGFELRDGINNTIHSTSKEAPSNLLFSVIQRGEVVDELKEFLEEKVDAKREFE